jgi:hypothetical protein
VVKAGREPLYFFYERGNFKDGQRSVEDCRILVERAFPGLGKEHSHKSFPLISFLDGIVAKNLNSQWSS